MVGWEGLGGVVVKVKGNKGRGAFGRGGEAYMKR